MKYLKQTHNYRKFEKALSSSISKSFVPFLLIVERNLTINSITIQKDGCEVDCFF